jgi:hypothetical protein
MSNRTRVVVLLGSLLLAGIAFASGVTGRGGSWLASVVAPIALLTLGFYVWSGRAKASQQDAEPRPLETERRSTRGASGQLARWIGVDSPGLA